MSESMLAWIGLDEFGNGEVGIKRAVIDGKVIVLAFVESQQAAEWLRGEAMRRGLQSMCNQWGQPIRLVRFVEMETLDEVKPT